jgi:hypothetical protein
MLVLWTPSAGAPPFAAAYAGVFSVPAGISA